MSFLGYQLYSGFTRVRVAYAENARPPLRRVGVLIGTITTVVVRADRSMHARDIHATVQVLLGESIK